MLQQYCGWATVTTGAICSGVTKGLAEWRTVGDWAKNSLINMRYF